MGVGVTMLYHSSYLTLPTLPTYPGINIIPLAGVSIHLALSKKKYQKITPTSTRLSKSNQNQTPNQQNPKTTKKKNLHRKASLLSLFPSPPLPPSLSKTYLFTKTHTYFVLIQIINPGFLVIHKKPLIFKNPSQVPKEKNL